MEFLGTQFADLAIGRIKSMINIYVDEQYQYQTTDVKAKLQQLCNSLTKIQAVVAAAQNMDIKEPNLLEWLSKLRDAIYDTEYVMDVFEYRRLEKEIEGRSSPEETNVADKGRTDKKVLDLLKLPSCSCLNFQTIATTFAKRLIFADKELNDLLEVVKKFSSLVAEIQELTSLLQLYQTNQNLVNQQASSSTNQGQETQETTSVPNEAVLLGRNEADKQLRKLLLQSSDNSDATFSVLSILGVGGVGKSALAQSVFNHQEVKDHFDVRAWVSVSTNFNIKYLVLGIIEAAGLPRPADLYNLTRLESIIEVLRKGLQSKKFLIVLDDVWEDMQDKWEEIAKALNCGEYGSKIIVTSRSSKVAEDMGVQQKMQIKLSPLDNKDFWELFQKCTFGDRTPESYPKHNRIAEQIANQLGGLPLAAKTVGAALHKNFSIEHWKEILTSKIWRQEGNKIMSALKLSYDHLPVHLKKCFMYCSLFPKDYMYDEKVLIDIWIALDCIKSTDITNKRLVDIQREYIDELVSRCFLEKTNYGHYIIHDLLHDLGEATIGNEVYRIEDGESLSKPIPRNVRHLYIETDSDASMNTFLQNFAPKQLRSLVYFASGEELVLQMSKETLENLKGLRFLYLHPRHHHEIIKIPESLGDLIHLRCINFNVNGGMVLPVSLSKLYQLQILHWTDGNTRVRLLSYIDKLINLRHVDSPYPADPDNGIFTSYLGHLKSLEGIPTGQYKIDGERGKDIAQLGELDKIGGSLALLVRTKSSQEEIRKTNLNRKKYITKLSIIDRVGGIDDEAIETLKPHENLEELEILGCRDINKVITWLPMISNLQYLKLEDLPNMQGIPNDVGHLLFLQELILSKLPSVRQIDVAGDNSGYIQSEVLFPSLISISMFDMQNLEGWPLPLNNNCNKMNFPKLWHVMIKGCPKLMKIGESPNQSFLFPSQLLLSSFALYILDPGFLYKESILKKEKQMRFYAVDMWPFLTEYHPYTTFLERFFSSILSLVIYSFQQQFLPTSLPALSSLKTLEIDRCFCLKRLPESLQALSSLKTLKINSCWNLERLPESLKTLSDLETLEIKNCHKLELVELEENNHHLPSSIKRLAINSCCAKMKFLPESLQTLSSLEILDIYNCDGLESLGPNIDSHHHFPPSAKELSIAECYNLKFLYATNMQTLSSLEVLRIERCSELSSMVNSKCDDHAHLPPSLRKLEFRHCEELKIPVASIQLLSSLETLIIEDCDEFKKLLFTGQPNVTIKQLGRTLFPNVKKIRLR